MALAKGRAVLEASGNVTLATVRDIAATGVDCISSGANHPQRPEFGYWASIFNDWMASAIPMDDATAVEDVIADLGGLVSSCRPIRA